MKLAEKKSPLQDSETSLFGHCNVSSMPIRAEASDSSEMVSQLLFGEFFEKINATDKSNWIKIKSLHDDYEGFVDPKQVFFLEQKEFDALQKKVPQISSKTIRSIYFNNKHIKIQQGSDTRCLGETTSHDNLTAIEFATSYLGAPYLWGGRSPFGIDCSGLTQIVFAYKKINLPRDASQQVKLGKNIPFGTHQFWDLVFFKNEIGRVIHVGIILEGNKVLHAHGEVKTSILTEKGLLNDSKDDITHLFHSIKRIN